ncbi:hypothetical protein HNV12_03680 [Methanococcoides sp. SA1]|nr:hypothetical protein [Methanococcoides sp. SA1]
MEYKLGDSNYKLDLFSDSSGFYAYFDDILIGMGDNEDEAIVDATEGMTKYLRKEAGEKEKKAEAYRDLAFSLESGFFLRESNTNKGKTLEETQ